MADENKQPSRLIPSDALRDSLQKSGPIPRTRVVPQAEGMGLTSRIRRALLEDTGLTQRIKTAFQGGMTGRFVKMTQDQNSLLYMKSTHWIMLIIMLALVFFMAYLAFSARLVDLQLQYPGGTTAKVPDVSISILEGRKVIPIPDYERQVTFRRYDIYGEDLSDKDYVIVDQDKKKVDPLKLTPGTYTLRIHKEGFKPQDVPLEIGKVNLEVAVKLEPLIEEKRELKLLIQDPLFETAKIEPDSVTLLTTNKQIKGARIKSGKYPVKIEKAGYQPKEMELYIPEDGIVTDKITLEYAKRSVNLLIDDKLHAKGKEPEVVATEIKLSQKGQQLAFSSALLPGHYDVDINRDGYYPYKGPITVYPGADMQHIKIPMTALDRVVVVVPNYDIAPATLRPDKAYLTDLAAINKDVIPITDGLRVTPGEYWVKVEKANYHPYGSKLQIEPSSQPFQIKAHLISVSKLVMLQITSDYDVEPNVNPNELLMDMRINKPGYVPIDWGNNRNRTEGTKAFPIYPIAPEKKEIQVPVFLETIPRRVILEVTSELDKGPLNPDEATLQRFVDGKPVSESIDLKKEQDVKVKPGRYMLSIRKYGFEKIYEEVIVAPDLHPHVEKREPPAIAREVVSKLRGDWEPDKEVVPDEIKLDRQPFGFGTRKKPGSYNLSLSKKGYYPVDKTLIIKPGEDPVYVEETFKAKPRKLTYKVEIFDDKTQTFIDVTNTPNVIVTLDKNPLQQGQFMPPKRSYEARCEIPGYDVELRTFDLEPDDKEYALTFGPKPKERDVILTVYREFAGHREEILPNKATIDGKAVDNKTNRPSLKSNKTYHLSISHDGYKPINEPVDLIPGVGPYVIERLLDPKDVEIRFEVTYDVAPQNTKLEPIVQVESSTPAFMKQLVQGDKIRPNKYNVTVSAEGYETLLAKEDLQPSESGYILRYKLQASPRPVALKITTDAESEKEQKLTVLLNAEPFSKNDNLVENIKPGRYSLQIEKPGYQTIKKDIFIAAGVTPHEIKEMLAAIPRPVILRMFDLDSKEALTPIQLTVGELPASNTFKPGKYKVFAKIKHYQDMSDDIEIKADPDPFVKEWYITKNLTLVIPEITGDYNNEKLTPSEITFDANYTIPAVGEKFTPTDHELSVYVPGYERLREQVTVPSMDKFILSKKLNSKPRKVVFNINADYPSGTKLNPDKVTFNGQVVVDGQEFKPVLSGYQAEVTKEGYVPYTGIINFPPSEDWYDFKLELKALPRRLKFELDSDYKRGEPIPTPVNITLNDAAYQGDAYYYPGKPKISISCVGYETQTFDDVEIPAGKQEDVVVIKRTLIALPRNVEIITISEYTNKPFDAQICLLGGRRTDEGEYKPGMYEVSIGHPGYLPIRENYEVVPGEGTLVIEKYPPLKKRPVEARISFDREYPSDLPPHVIKFKHVVTGEEFMYKDGLEIKPGDYRVYGERAAFDTLQKLRTIEPGDVPYILELEMEALPVEILLDIKHNVPPPAEFKPYTVTFIDNAGKGNNVEHGNRIKPGEYMLDIVQEGYILENREKIKILADVRPTTVSATLTAKPRTLSFGMIVRSAGKEIIIPAIEITSDGNLVTAKDLFKPGQEYNLRAKFREYKTTQQRVKIPAGEGPYAVAMNLVKFNPYEFSIAQKYARDEKGILLDNIAYRLEIIADGEVVEPHHLGEFNGVGTLFSTFYALPSIKNVRMVSGIYFKDFIPDADKINTVGDLDKIEFSNFIAHYRTLAAKDHITAFESFKKRFMPGRTITEKTADKPKILALAKADRQIIVDWLNSLSLSTDIQKKDRQAMISELLK